MFSRLSNKFYDAQLIALLALNTSKMFEKINNLPWYKEAHREWIDNQNISQGASVLDIGCASGTLINYLAQSGCKASGVDFSNQMIELAIRKYPAIDFRIADAKDLPYDDDSFDAVVSSSLINIIKDPQRAIAEMVRICKPGGIISILVPKSGFTIQELERLSRSINASRFSMAALRAWNRKPPKMEVQELVRMFRTEGLIADKHMEYLQGMIFSLSVVKN